ncbi:U-box domain-containing 18-like [Olea europaea subsp. europaea]|uniref:RING-type E3 ubiquitin transferase n=1 Tax=Olea europaea subsp. europaea TaxID=158383 RepID=A0A8S0S365_OLEEU|nr:U-box domain-containing 18-like [Olea europaea subsp. europaea]
MLVKSEHVSTQCRVLVRSIVVALDVLLLDGLDVCVEVRELVEFVRRQALKAKFDVEVDDRRASRKVVRVLERFGNGIVPENGDLTRVLEYLGIQSWAECNKEVKFLEGEIGQECLTAEKREVGFLSSLMAFMIYCRCTLFVIVDNAPIRQSDDVSCISDLIRCLNPDDLRCPITLEIMIDPVTISTGHTYDRSSIMKWFKSGNHTCPKTGERLISVDLVPNLAVKRIIKQIFLENRIPFVETGGRNHDIQRLAGAGSVTAEQVMTLLAYFLVGRLMGGMTEEQHKAAYEIRLLTKTSVFNRSCLVEADAIPPLLNLISSSNPAAQENAIAALMNLSKYSKSKRMMIESGGLNLIVGVLNEGLRIEARQYAAGTLFYLASVEEYRKMIGKVPDAIPSLMELVKDGPDRAKKKALVSIFSLIMNPENLWRVLAAGFVPLLVNLLTSSQREDLITDSLAILATLAEKLDGTMAIMSAGTLPVISEVLGSLNSQAAKEYCVSLLLALCINDGADVVPLLVKSPSLMVSLYSLLTDGTPRASKKASSLIRILHAFNEKSSSGLMASALPPEQFIHVW